MISAMTRNQVISFILSVVICLFLVLCGFPPVTNLLTRMDKPWLVNLVSSLSVMTHFQPFTTGLVDSRDVLFFLLIIGFALFANGVIIRSHQTSMDSSRQRKNFEALLYSTGGVAAMFIVLVAVYIVTSTVKLRLDVTAEKAHTLSPGTKRILATLDSRVWVRFYCTQTGNTMPPPLRTYARRVEDLLREYEQEANGKLIIEKFDPRPDSDAEESARLNGVVGRAIGPFGTEKIYLGVAVSLLDEKFALPWLSAQRERLLEYDLSRAIARVVHPARPVVGIMSGLPVYGDPPTLLMHPGQTRAEEWAFVAELKKDFTVREVPLSASRIEDDIKVLVVAHPVEISDAAQFAIDQFVLRGGKLLAFVDPHAYFDQAHERSQNFSVVGDNAAGSSLDKLLKAWGLDMDINKVAADTSFAGRNPQTGDVMPTLLVVTRSGIDDKNVVTSQIDNLFLPFAGAITGQPMDGLIEKVLVRCSPNSELVDNLMATAGQQILRDFRPANRDYPLAVHLTGKFKTAFPNGRPAAAPSPRPAPSETQSRPASAEAKPDVRSPEGPSPAPNQLRESTGPGEVILVADTDMLNDKVCVRIQNVMGHRTIQPVNGNLNFVQSLVEQFAGDHDLISSRSRASMSRPFTRLKDMEAQAGKEWEQKAQVLEARQREMEQKIMELQTPAAEGQQQDIILSPEQQKELEQYQKVHIELARDLKEVRKNLRKDTDALEFRTKVINIGAMPLLVAVSGLGLAGIKIKRRTVK